MLPDVVNSSSPWRFDTPTIDDAPVEVRVDAQLRAHRGITLVREALKMCQTHYKLPAEYPQQQDIVDRRKHAIESTLGYLDDRIMGVNPNFYFVSVDARAALRDGLSRVRHVNFNRPVTRAWLSDATDGLYRTIEQAIKTWQHTWVDPFQTYFTEEGGFVETLRPRVHDVLYTGVAPKSSNGKDDPHNTELQQLALMLSQWASRWSYSATVAQSKDVDSIYPGRQIEWLGTYHPGYTDRRDATLYQHNRMQLSPARQREFKRAIELWRSGASARRDPTWRPPTHQYLWQLFRQTDETGRAVAWPSYIERPLATVWDQYVANYKSPPINPKLGHDTTEFVTQFVSSVPMILLLPEYDIHTPEDSVRRPRGLSASPFAFQANRDLIFGQFSRMLVIRVHRVDDSALEIASTPDDLHLTTVNKTTVQGFTAAARRLEMRFDPVAYLAQEQALATQRIRRDVSFHRSVDEPWPASAKQDERDPSEGWTEEIPLDSLMGGISDDSDQRVFSDDLEILRGDLTVHVYVHSTSGTSLSVIDVPKTNDPSGTPISSTRRANLRQIRNANTRAHQLIRTFYRIHLAGAETFSRDGTIEQLNRFGDGAFLSELLSPGVKGLSSTALHRLQPRETIRERPIVNGISHALHGGPLDIVSSFVYGEPTPVPVQPDGTGTDDWDDSDLGSSRSSSIASMSWNATTQESNSQDSDQMDTNGRPGLRLRLSSRPPRPATLGLGRV